MKIRMGFESRSYRVKQQFRRRMEATRVLNDDFYVRAQLMLNFLQKHGDRIVHRKHLAPGDASQTRFSWLSMLCRNLQESNFPSTEGCVCVCVCTP